MVMDTIQIRLSYGLMHRIDFLVETGIYSSRSDAIRDAVRQLVLEKMTGILAVKEDSVKQIRHARKKLSKEKFNLREINVLSE